MEKIIWEILEWLFGKKQKEREGAIYYFKSLLFLFLIVCYLSNRMWNMNDNIERVLSLNTITYITTVSKICMHFFTSLEIVSLAVFFIAILLGFLPEKILRDKEIVLMRIRLGAEIRMLNSSENVLLFLMIASMFEENVLQNYIAIYSNGAYILLIISVYEFLTSSMMGIINRFFLLKSHDEDDIVSPS